MTIRRSKASADNPRLPEFGRTVFRKRIGTLPLEPAATMVAGCFIMDTEPWIAISCFLSFSIPCPTT